MYVGEYKKQLTIFLLPKEKKCEQEAEPQLEGIEETSTMNEFVEDVVPLNTKIFEKKKY